MEAFLNVFTGKSKVEWISVVEISYSLPFKLRKMEIVDRKYIHQSDYAASQM